MLRAKLGRIRRGLAQAFSGQSADDEELRDLQLRLADADCRIDALHALEQEVLADRMRGAPTGVSPSIGKLLGTELKQLLTELALAVWGPAGAARLPLDQAEAHALALAEDAVYSMSAYLNDRAASIYGGSNEVQRNLIARHLLTS
jgi:acyl-CoA dehydrogenase